VGFVSELPGAREKVCDGFEVHLRSIPAEVRATGHVLGFLAAFADHNWVTNGIATGLTQFITMSKDSIGVERFATTVTCTSLF